MLDPKTHKEVLQIRAHAKLLYSLADKLLEGEGSRQNAKVKKLSESQLMEREAKLRAKIRI